MNARAKKTIAFAFGPFGRTGDRLFSVQGDMFAADATELAELLLGVAIDLQSTIIAASPEDDHTNLAYASRFMVDAARALYISAGKGTET